MIDSILDSIKKPLDIPVDYDVFDETIIMHINTVFSTLFSIGASPPTPFFIEDNTRKWSDFYGDLTQAMMVKTYMYIKVKLLFDPPPTSFAQQAFENNAKELEWRLGLMEYDFNPLSQPITNPVQNQGLKLLEQQIREVDKQVDTLDDEVDAVPDLTVIFDNNLEDD